MKKYYCFMALFNSTTTAMNPHTWVKDVWWVYGCPKNDLILKYVSLLILGNQSFFEGCKQ